MRQTEDIEGGGKGDGQDAGVTRRQFLASGSAGLGALAIGPRALPSSRVLGANERINLAVIGHGMRGPQLIDQIHRLPEEANAKIAAVCEIYDRRKEEIKAKAGLPKCHHDYGEILADPDIDALVIAVPDHWHLQMSLDAMRAGKDVFVEKPMTLRWREAKMIRDVQRKTGRVVQVGAGSASEDLWWQARELIGEGGAGLIGKVVHFQTSYNRNIPGGDWNYKIHADANEKTVDWDLWQKHAAHQFEWNDSGAERFFRFRKYWDYSGGVATDLLYHKLAHMVLALGFPFPRKVVANGGNYVHFDREVPDTFTVLADFENDCSGMLLATGGNRDNIIEAIRGEHGTMTFEGDHVVIRPQRPFMSAVQEKAGQYDDLEILERQQGGRHTIETIRRRTQPRSGHMLNFIQCMRSRKLPHLNAEAGYRVMTTIGLAIEAYRENRVKLFDPEKQEVL